MADYIGEFNQESGAADAIKRQRDFDDLQIELSGVEIGRMPRFLSPEVRESLADRKTGRGSKSSFSALDLLLLNDPEFARAYERAMDALIEAENVVQTALEKAIAKAEETQLALDTLMDKAMRLPDGSAVFMDQNGIVRDENGAAIDQALADALEWQGYEPAFAEFENTRKADNEADAHVLTIREDQADLGNIRQELSDRDNPPTMQRVEELNKRTDEITDNYEVGQSVELENNAASFDVKKFDLPAR